MAFNLGQALLGGGMGFLTGGPVGAGVGFLGGGFSGKPSGMNNDNGRSSLTGTGDDLRNYLQRQAYMSGVRSVMGGAAGGGAQGASPQRGGGVQTRTDQQRGGQGYPYPSGGGEGLPQADNMQMFREALAGGLAGVGGPQAAFQGQYAQGRDVLNAQAQQSRGTLQTALAQRGMLRSGALSTGLAGIERGRLGSLQGLLGQISEQRTAAASQAQQQAMGIMAGQVSQTQQIAASQPSFADYLAELGGAYAQSRFRPERFDLAARLREIQQPSYLANPPSTGNPLRWDAGGGGR